VALDLQVAALAVHLVPGMRENKPQLNQLQRLAVHQVPGLHDYNLSYFERVPQQQVIHLLLCSGAALF